MTSGFSSVVSSYIKDFIYVIDELAFSIEESTYALSVNLLAGDAASGIRLSMSETDEFILVIELLILSIDEFIIETVSPIWFWLTSRLSGSVPSGISDLIKWMDALTSVRLTSIIEETISLTYYASVSLLSGVAASGISERI